MSKIAYIFDVDGTLTPSRSYMLLKFHTFLKEFAEENEVFLVTGSDKPKTIEQVSEELYNKCKRVYNCSGSDIYEADKNIYTNDWKASKELKDFLLLELKHSYVPKRTGLHLEERPGMLNFSTVGRNANPAQRAMYVKYDTEFEERVTIAKRIKNAFPDIEAKVGGDTGIDIFPIGCDKSQILKDFDDYEIHFFGDKMLESGNDYPLMKAIEKANQGISYHVKNWEETLKILKGL